LQERTTKLLVDNIEKSLFILWYIKLQQSCRSAATYDCCWKTCQASEGLWRFTTRKPWLLKM